VALARFLNALLEPPALAERALPTTLPMLALPAAADAALATHFSSLRSACASAAELGDARARLFAAQLEARQKRAAFRVFFGADAASSAARTRVGAEVASGRLAMRPEAEPARDAGLRARIAELL